MDKTKDRAQRREKHGRTKNVGRKEGGKGPGEKQGKRIEQIGGDGKDNVPRNSARSWS